MTTGKQFILKLLTAICAMIICVQGLAQTKQQTLVLDESGIPKEKLIDITHIRLDATIDAPQQLFRGIATMNFISLRTTQDSIVFYAPGMKDCQVLIANRLVKSLTNGDNLVVFPSETLKSWQTSEIKFIYTVKNPKELYFNGWDDPSIRGRKQIWAHRPFGWIPFHDEMGTQDIYITFDKNFKVVSNGERVSQTLQGDTAYVWHYKLDKPHPYYSTCLVIGDYLLKNSVSKEGLPLEMWIYPEQEDHYPYTYNLMNEMLTFMQTETGTPYPYSLYRNIPVMNYLYGAMETTTSTIFGDYMVNDARGANGRTYLNTNIHELAHQWFGNCINDKTVRDLWLTESFATYFAKIFERQQLGENQYEYQRELERQKALKIAQSNSFPLATGKAGVERWYQKGSLVMDMLRDVIGDEDFKKAVKYYLLKHAYSEAESNDFLRAIYETSGRQLDWFFLQWIYKGGEPEYKLSRSGITDEKGNSFTQLDVSQVQQQNEYAGLFRMPVNIEVHYTDNSVSRSLEWISEQTSRLLIPNPEKKKVEFVVFDAGNRILKKLNYDRNSAELLAQLEKSASLADRFEALTALRNTPLAEKRESLIRVFEKENFHLLKTEIIQQLNGDSLSYPLIIKAISDPEVLVRKAVTDNTKVVPKLILVDYEKLLSDSAYFIVEAALVNLTNTLMADKQANPAQINRYFELTAKETGWRGLNIRIAWLTQKLLLDPSNKVLWGKLIDYSNPIFEFETRMNAISALQKLNYLDEKSLEYLTKACLHWNFKLNTVARDALQHFYKQLKYKMMIDQYVKNLMVNSSDQNKILKILN